MMFRSIIESPLGPLEAVADDSALLRLSFANDPEQSLRTEAEALIVQPNDVILKTAYELNEYFKGTKRAFTVPLAPRGTEFQRRVWLDLSNVPFGVTRTYGEQAHHLGDMKAIRAVARANGANPIAIIIPCHRIIGAGGKLTGYAGGIERKRWLLQHEGANVPGFGTSRQAVLGL